MNRVVSKARVRRRPRWPELFRLTVRGKPWKFVLVDGTLIDRDENEWHPANAIVISERRLVEVSNRIPKGQVAGAIAGAIGIIIGEASVYGITPEAAA